MQRHQLEHIIRAAAGITGATEFVVIGSQAILGQFPNPPAELLISIEADLFSTRNPGDAELIDGSIGEASPFHQTLDTTLTGFPKKRRHCRRDGKNGWFRFITRIRAVVPASVSRSMTWLSRSLWQDARRIRTSFAACYAMVWLTRTKFASVWR